MRKLKLPLLLMVAVMSLLVVCSITPAYALVYAEGDVWIDTAGNTMTAEEAAQWTYTSATAGITLTKYSGTFTDGVINGNMPASINGKPVIDIDTIFANRKTLVTAPDIPDTVTSMCSTFQDCTALINPPVIPASVTDMTSTFQGCTALVDAPVIPEGVIDMTSTFYNCTSLVDAPVIPEGVIDMTNTFYNCTSLVDAPVIPDSVTSMVSTFSQCYALVTAPEIPDSVTTMTRVFQSCTSLEVAPEIPDSVTSINYAFSGCTALETAPIIPDSVTSTTYAFRGCTALTGTVYLGDFASPSNMFVDTTLPITVQFTQYSIKAKETMTGLPSNITLQCVETDDKGELTNWIGADGNYMYEKEIQLWEYATAYKSVGYIGQFVDGKIVGQVPMNIDGKDITKFYTTSIGNFDRGIGDIATELTEFPVIPETFTNLASAFSGAALVTEPPVIPASVTNMDSTFKGCSSLKTAPEIPAGVTNMERTFQNCTSLEAAPEIPDGVTDMDYTFHNTSILEGDVYIPSSVKSMVHTFGSTVKSINMIYDADNTVAEAATVPENVTKVKVVSDTDYDDSSEPTEAETESDEVSVSVKSSADVYTLEVGETLQLEATVTNENLKYQWVVQDIFDTDPSAPYATINSNGLITAVDGPGYVIAGLLVQFEDGSEHGYGMVLIEITKDNTIAAVPNDYRTGTTSSQNPSGIRVPYGGSGSYLGGFNPSYSYESTGYTTPDQLGSVSINGSGTGGSTGGTGGTGGTTGGTDGGGGGGFPVIPTPGGDGTSSTPSHVTSLLDGTKYTEQSDITGEIIDKFVNYLRVGKGNQFEIVNLDPVGSEYKLVSLSLTEQPSVVITQDGYATAVYEGASIIVLADKNDNVIDWHLILVGDADTYDGEMPNYTIEDMEYETRVNIGEGNMPIYGKIESLQMIDVTIPVTMTFVIDTERLFHAEDAQMVSNCPAPLDITILSYNKSSNAPDIVSPDTYTDDEWNNLGTNATRENLGLMINELDLTVENLEFAHIASAFVEEQTYDLSLSAKYGKAWNNTEDIIFTYNIVFEFAMPE